MEKVYIVWYVNPEIHHNGKCGIWRVYASENDAQAAVNFAINDFGFQAWYTCEEVF